MLEKTDGADGEGHALDGQVRGQFRALNEVNCLKWASRPHRPRARLSIVNQAGTIEFLAKSSHVAQLDHRAIAELPLKSEAGLLHDGRASVWIQSREADEGFSQHRRGKPKATGGGNEVIALHCLRKDQGHVVHLIAPEVHVWVRGKDTI